MGSKSHRPHVAQRPVEARSDVTNRDHTLIPAYGGNEFNIRGFQDNVRASITVIRDRHGMAHLLKGQECVFNLAGQVSHIDSMTDPETDLEINCRAQLGLMEALREAAPDTRVVYASTRQIYGRPQYLPVDERHPLCPTDVNGINKQAGEQYHLLYADVYGLPTVALRLTNTYGPRQLMHHGRQGFIPVFIRAAMEGRPITLYGGGGQIRDANYVDDVVDAFMRRSTAGTSCPVAPSTPACPAIVQPSPVHRDPAGDRGLRNSRRCGLARGQGTHRHRRLRSGSFADHRGAGVAAHRGPRGRTAANGRVLPRARRALLVTPIHLVELSLDEPEVKVTLAAMQRVLERGWFVLGPEVSAFEEELASSAGTTSAVGVGSGTDALILGLRGLGIGPGDEVVIPAFTAFPTAAAVLEVGATPVMVDVRHDLPLLDLDATLARLTARTRAVVLVHLYGIAADAEMFDRELRARGVDLIEDCAQAQGGMLASGRAVGRRPIRRTASIPRRTSARSVMVGAVVTSTKPGRRSPAWRSHGERTARLPPRTSC